MTRLQDERRLTAAWQSHRTKQTHAALEEARSRTDRAVTAFHAAEAKVGKTVDAGKERDLTKALSELTGQRNQVDSRAVTRGGSYGYYTGATESGTTLLAEVLRSDDGRLAHSAGAVASLAQISELLSREDALLTGAQPAGYLSSTVRQAFSGHVAAQRQAARNLDTRGMPGSAAKDYRAIADTPQWAVLQRIEDGVGRGARQSQSQNTTPGTTTPSTSQNATPRWELPDRSAEWRPAADAVTEDLRDVTSASLDGMAEQGSERADDALLSAIAGSVAVLAVLVLTAFLAIRLSRSLPRRLTQLRDATEQWTDRELPDVAERLKQGEREVGAALVPYDDSAPHDEVGRLITAVREQQRAAVDELGGLAEAIDARWKTAAETSQQKSRKREGAETVVLGLLRRNQLLISQLITLIDSLERREHDPELLTDIFKIDHLVTRLRRDLENQSLIVGVQPGRRWSKPVPVFQVLRSAVAETVDYTRVEVETAPEFALSGRVVADVGHILAALIENGTAFSPPHTHVNVRAEEVAGGRLAVEVIDRGLGMDAEQYEHLNQLLADPPEPDVTRLGEIPQLGLFVVALLANRIGLEITLGRSAYGGTKAVVLLPSELLEEAPPLLPSLADHAPEPGAGRDHAPPRATDAPAREQAAEHVQPVRDPAEEPVREPVREPVAEPAHRPVTEPVRDPVAARARARAAALDLDGRDSRDGRDGRDDADIAIRDPEDDLGGYPAYTGGGLLTRPRTHKAPDAPALTALVPPRAEPEAPSELPEPAGDEVSQKLSKPSQGPLTLPTRRPGENLAAPLRRSPGQPPHTERHPADEGHAPQWPTPDRAGAIAGAVQRAGRQARTESSDAQCNGASPEDA
ncbi:sensor histidine kinase [Streptomyces winkii]|uniref:sensor histidine kinase n=1 Tax=Streptomyces winkii TaxID=3051178 RepID=UPI0028D13CFC|nr:nitrate- and nitrite sensing domain-containing protein [Streptomyces sp. DSM 40971]